VAKTTQRGDLNVDSSPNIIRVVKSRIMRFAGHVTRMGLRRGFGRETWGKETTW